MVDRSVQCKDGVSDSAQVLPLKKIIRLENVGFVNSILHHRGLKTIYKFWSLTILNILRSSESCSDDLQIQERQTCSTTMFSISLKPAPEVFIFFIAPGHRVFINLHRF